jgi:soluble lytic murein transglycosylase-like protein
LVMWIIVSFAGVARAEIDMNIIAQIESSGNPNAVSFRGAKYGRGIYQVSEICLKEYNSFNRTDIKPDKLFNPETCYMVAYWYLHKRIPQMLRHYQKPVTLDNILISYNAGISYVVNNKPLKRETTQYLTRYILLDK